MVKDARQPELYCKFHEHMVREGGRMLNRGNHAVMDGSKWGRWCDCGIKAAIDSGRGSLWLNTVEV